MKRKVTLLLFIFYYSINFSQEKIYLDENMTVIDSVLLKKKCAISVFKCLSFNTDSVKVNKVLKKYEFGKITNTQYHQLRKLFIQSQKRPIDSSSTLIINYRDSLYDNKVRKDAKQRTFDHQVIQYDSTHHNVFNTKIFNSYRENWIKRQKKCVKKMKRKYNAETFYIFKSGNIDSIKKYPDLNWIKDRGLFKNVFFKIMYKSHFLILKPNGDYFLSGGVLEDKKLKKLIKSKDWTDYKKDLKASVNAHSKNGIGFFEKSIYRKTNCF